MLARRASVVLLAALWGCQPDTTGGGPGGGTTGTGGGGTGAAGGAGGAGGTEQGGGGQGGVSEPCAPPSAPSSGPAEIIKDASPDRILLRGAVITPEGVLPQGEVLVDGEHIQCVGVDCSCEPGAGQASVVQTNGIIAPGLIDTHNHILFDIFDETDWRPTLPATCAAAIDCEASPYCSNGKCACVGGACRYTDHTQWTSEAEYGLMLDYKQCLEDASQGKPVWCPQALDGGGSVRCEMDKWGELKGLVAGTTSIVGLPGSSAACFGSLARTVDVPRNDLDTDKIQTSTSSSPANSTVHGACDKFASDETDAYLIHLAEGVNDKAHAEWDKLLTLPTDDPDGALGYKGCLVAPETAITHGTALTPAEFEVMAAAGMKLIWSPASNVFLYGATTDIPAARAAGLTVALAPDWSLGGSQNLLDELKFARAWSDQHWSGALSDQDLVDMVTRNAAEVLGLAGVLGALAPGAMADILVISGDAADPHHAIVQASPLDVAMVLVGGSMLYGDEALSPIAVNPCEGAADGFTLCGGAGKVACIAEPGEEPGDKLPQTHAEIEAALEGALAGLDAIQPLPPGDCSPACAADEQCFARTVHPEVAPSSCPGGACAAGEACFQTTVSGSYQCLSVHACAPARTKALAPVTPLLRCP
ncbi:MAG: amidohydrolase family protein [Polyangiaceae bacterium]|nr:amidohydrolase family protein [Polyangiaceae bacterium]